MNPYICTFFGLRIQRTIFFDKKRKILLTVGEKLCNIIKVSLSFLFFVYTYFCAGVV
jgi:hypothetical protein